MESTPSNMKDIANKADTSCPADENGQSPIPAPSYDKDEKWVREYIKQFGEEPSFF